MFWSMSFGWLRQPKFRIIHYVISEAPVSSFSFGGHLRQYWFVSIDIIVDDHFALGGVQAVKPAGILRERPTPGDWQGQEQCIETGVVETFPKITSSGD